MINRLTGWCSVFSTKLVLTMLLMTGASISQYSNLYKTRYLQLSGSLFRFSSIERAGSGKASRSWLRWTKRAADTPVPLQLASQGTLSTVAIFAIIHQVVAQLALARSSDQPNEVCAPSLSSTNSTHTSIQNGSSVFLAYLGSSFPMYSSSVPLTARLS